MQACSNDSDSQRRVGGLRQRTCVLWCQRGWKLRRVSTVSADTGRRSLDGLSLAGVDSYSLKTAWGLGHAGGKTASPVVEDRCHVQAGLRVSCECWSASHPGLLHGTVLFG